MHSRTRQEWNVSLRAGWFKSPSHLNKGPLCELKFFLYSSFAHPPVVDDSHKVVGQKCELSGFCKFSYCLHLSGFSLWRKTGKNWCDVQKSAQTFRHIHEARTAISSLIWNEKDKKSFRPPPPSSSAGQSWVCLQDCMPSTFALQCIAPEGNQVASPGVRPPALSAIISSWRVNVSDANTLSHRACQKNKQHKGGDTHSKHEWQIPCLACTQIQKKHGVSVLTSTYLPARQTKPRLFTIGEHFPESDTKHPHVWGKGERADAKTLWSTPGEKGGRQTRSKRKSYWRY